MRKAKKQREDKKMKHRKFSVMAVALATGLCLAPLNSRKVYADPACSNKTLRGSFGTYRTGNTSAGPLAAVGHITFDGDGNSMSTQSISRNGVFTFDVSNSGLYVVEPDCTGKFLTPTGDEVARIVVVDGGNEVFLLSETPGNAVYAVSKKIAP
jgi:hypothetical protein